MSEESSSSSDVYQEYSEFYDLYVGDRLDDLPMYKEHAANSGAPILEIGAGSGRLTIPLASDGYDVVAVDISPSMLVILREKLTKQPVDVRSRISVVEADVLPARIVAGGIRAHKRRDNVVRVVNELGQSERVTVLINSNLFGHFGVPRSRCIRILRNPKHGDLHQIDKGPLPVVSLKGAKVHTHRYR